MNINLENYEEFAMDYLENNLNETDRRQFEFFLEKNPEIRKIFENFELITLPEFYISFPSKDKLLKHENKKAHKIFPFWIRVAAAILLPFLFFVLSRNSSSILPDPTFGDYVLEELPLVPHIDPTPEMMMQLLEVNIDDKSDEKKVKLINPNVISNEIKRKASQTSGFAEQMEIAVVEEKPVELRTLINPLPSIDARDFILVLQKQVEFNPLPEMIFPMERENDGWNKIGRFLAKSNLMPSSLEGEWSSIRIKERFLPESLITNAN